MSTAEPVATFRLIATTLAQLAAWMEATPAAHASADAPPAEPESQDHGCMARLAAGDTQALRPIFDRWKLPLLSYFYRALGSRADAEDLALQTFERVYRAAPRYRPEVEFPAWLFAIARGELLHELRRRRRKPVVPVPPEELVAFNAPADHTKETEELLLTALQSLPERQRTAVVLAAADELDSSAIARVLGVSLNNFHVILHRARVALRERFNQLKA